jgi:hypothetical protein
MNPDVIISHSPLPLSSPALELLAHLQQHGSATIPELEDIAAGCGIDTEGDLLFGIPPYLALNMVAWDGITPQFLTCLKELVFDVEPRPTTTLRYLQVGRSLPLPVGRPDRTTPYVRLHWLPMVFQLREESLFPELAGAQGPERGRPDLPVTSPPCPQIIW